MPNMASKFADISDELWDRVQWLLPTPPVRRHHKGGRPPTPDRVVLSGILYRLRTGCQWEAIAKEFGSGQYLLSNIQEMTAGSRVRADASRNGPLLGRQSRVGMGLDLARQRPHKSAKRGPHRPQL